MSDRADHLLIGFSDSISRKLIRYHPLVQIFDSAILIVKATGEEKHNLAVEVHLVPIFE